MKKNLFLASLIFLFTTAIAPLRAQVITSAQIDSLTALTLKTFDVPGIVDNRGKAIGIKMEAISPLTDFSFDFQDLDFKRVN
jgi:hypothetical protein